MQDASQVPADLAADDAPVQALRRAPVQGPLFVEFVKGAKTPVVGTLPYVDQVEVFQRRPMSCPDGSVPWWSWCEVEKSRMKIGLRRELRGDGRMYVETRSTTGWTRLDSVGLVWLGSLVQKPQGPTRHLLCRDVRTTLSWPGNGIIPPVFPRKPGWKVACQSLCVLLRRRRFKTCFKSLKALRACSMIEHRQGPLNGQFDVGWRIFMEFPDLPSIAAFVCQVFSALRPRDDGLTTSEVWSLMATKKTMYGPCKGGNTWIQLTWYSWYNRCNWSLMRSLSKVRLDELWHHVLKHKLRFILILVTKPATWSFLYRVWKPVKNTPRQNACDVSSARTVRMAWSWRSWGSEDQDVES